MRRVLCLFGVHARSRGQARSDQMKITSVCRYCRRPMEKHGARWRIDREAGTMASETGRSDSSHDSASLSEIQAATPG